MDHVDAIKKGGEHNNGAITGEPDKILKARIEAISSIGQERSVSCHRKAQQLVSGAGASPRPRTVRLSRMRSCRGRSHRLYRSAGPAPPPGRAAGCRHQGGRRRRPMDPGAAGGGSSNRTSRPGPGVKHAIACANGTDALLLVLRAWGVGPGDAVFVPAFTFAATAEVVALAGASPVFVDVLPDTFNMDPASLEAAIALVKQDGKLTPKVVMPVDLFGQPADYRALAPIAQREGLKLLCDTAQGFGGLLDGKRAGAIGDAAATSFFPAKPLGCYGDGGACFTNDDALKDMLLSLRMHGQGSDRYEHVRDRAEFAAGHHPGRDPDREAENLRRRDRKAERGGPALQRGLRGLQPHQDAACDRGRRLDLGAIHACRWPTAPNSRPT